MADDKKIFLNLPVTDVARATAFYEAIGFTRNPGFSNAQSASMVWSDAIHVMLLSHDFFDSFTGKERIDPRSHTGTLVSLSLPSRDAVDAINVAALGAGGRELHGAEDHGFMYARAFEDPDGNGFGVLWMDPDFAARGAHCEEEA